jgi:hypothetical protein
LAYSAKFAQRFAPQTPRNLEEKLFPAAGGLAYFLLLRGCNVQRLTHTADTSGRAPERRVHRRTLVGASALLLIGDEHQSAECIDVSMGGAQVRTAAHVATGAIVRLELALGLDRGSVSIQCEVVRAHGEQVGLRFLALDRASLEAILSLF